MGDLIWTCTKGLSSCRRGRRLPAALVLEVWEEVVGDEQQDEGDSQHSPSRPYHYLQGGENCLLTPRSKSLRCWIWKERFCSTGHHLLD